MTAAVGAAAVLSAAATGAVVHVVDGRGAPVAVTAATGTSTAAGAVPSAATGSVAQTALAAVSRSVVQINTVLQSGGGGSGLAGFAPGAASGAGSGIVVGGDGTIVTNAHVVAGAASLTVTIPGAGTHPASVLGSDPARDLAVVRAQGVSGLPVATFADSSRVQVGDSVLAIGNAEGYGGQNTVTAGIISATDRTLPGAPSSPGHFLQTDAAINPGNSGGPLVDTTGRVVGITSEVATGSDSSRPAQGIGLAIPSNDLTAQLASLTRGGSPAGAPGGATAGATGGYLGVGLADTVNANGAGITAVSTGSPAARAGLQPGDVVTAANGSPVTSGGDLATAVRGSASGSTLTLTVQRPTGSASVRVTLAAWPTTG